MRTFTSQASASASADCSNIQYPAEELVIAQRTFAGIAQALNFVREAIQNATGQDAFGFNTQVVSVAFVAVEAIPTAVNFGLESAIAVTQNKAERAEASCLKELSRAINSIDLTSVEGALQTIETATVGTVDVNGEPVPTRLETLLQMVKDETDKIEAVKQNTIDLEVQMTQDHAGLMADHEGIVTNDNTNSTAIKTNVEAARKEVVDLLRTPEGQRITGN
jgi:hypothetical protein